jgi:hypothetical protein
MVFNSKIQALLAEIKKLQVQEPGAKMCIFSCFNGGLHA